MRKERSYTSGEEVANAVTHVVGSHLGAAMLALLVWKGATSGVDVAWKTTSGAIPSLPLNFSKIAFLSNSDGHQTHVAPIIFCTYKSECRDGCL